MDCVSDSIPTRASRACQRCGQRKVKCDAVLGTGPCSRCRMDRVDQGCIVMPSRRGTYNRSRKRPRLHSPSQTENDPSRNSTISRGDAGTQEHNAGTWPVSDPSLTPTAVSQPGTSSLTLDDGVSLSQVDKCVMPRASEAQLQTQWWPNNGREYLHGSIATNPSQPSLSEVENRGTQKTLASMFEEFLEKQGQSDDGSATKLGLVLFAKRCFDDPDQELLDQLVTAFLDNFCPLYSIVNKAEVLESHRAHNLPWILLHAICFLGATFCDSAIIHKSSYKSRLHARRAFYDKAKVLFDVGYKTDKVVLLQTVIMLSFWGPKMNSYWNPCSWVVFAVTIAALLGIHRSAAFARVTDRDKGLLKRLWWTVLVRDAYCAALLGKPFRIDMALCDTEMLDLADFRPEEETNDSALFRFRLQNCRLFHARSSSGGSFLVIRRWISMDYTSFWTAGELKSRPLSDGT
ncbi:hypothetical protein EK21DRAFT_85827 [Setomelanomma holmii]|uniref:Zn(2)-C6 fungal-type domain-containing protein n=1 Tax=Setomelanomma holmii TaxID=210430 RepID=A0A9P4HI72_9PLEO|nr:hypothetical protein EK21DRAFT_85827 [Setomelanomma holmii]